MVTSLSERFRRAILSDDLGSAKTIAERAALQTCNDANPFDIRNQTVLRSGHHHYTPSSSGNIKSDSSGSGGGRDDSKGSRAVGSSGGSRGSTNTSFLNSNTVEILPTLSATQYHVARQNRIRERNREAGRCKSSLTLAIENGASIELIQWLLDEGHERGQLSRDVRDCTMVSLAAQYSRIDVIDALCIDAVAHVASVHHQEATSFDTMHRHVISQDDEDYDYYDEDEEENKDEDDAEKVEDDEIQGEVDGGDGIKQYQSTKRIEQATARPPMSRPKREAIIARRRSSVEIERTGSKHKINKKDDGDRASLGSNENEEDIVAKELLQLLDAPDELGRTALALASMKGFEGVVNKLLELGASINLADDEGNTPLHYAASYDHLIIVQIFIEKGCTFAAKNALGFTASDYAYTLSLKEALEAFARDKYERDRKGVVAYDNHEGRVTRPFQKLKNTILSSSHKPLHSSTQYRLATHLRDLDF